MKKCSLIVLSVLFCLLLVACSGQSRRPEAQPDAGVYLSPTRLPQTPLVLAMPSPTFTIVLPTADLRPTSTPACKDDLRFIEDVTIPDGTRITPDETVDKRWKVENFGSCNWDERYRLRLISGPSLGASTEQALYPARGGTQAIIQILFTAPHLPGTYRSAWQAHSPQGEPFGDTIYIEIIVSG
ncbi:MAG: hypothetical protein JXB15_15215 [Anaerolineales bacterium]|nr:hypothetical protein [Anaerolineales bacterium]